MNSNTSENLYSPRRNVINEDNLNFLHEEASQYLDDNEEYPGKSERFSLRQNKLGNKIF